MGWRGTIRAIAAAQRRAEREAVRRHRDYGRQLQAAHKHAQRAAAIEEVAAYENYVALLRSVHKDCGPIWNWAAIRNAPPPPEPAPSNARETQARRTLDSFNPGFLDRLLGRVERKRQELAQAVATGRAADEAAFLRAREEHARQAAEWSGNREFAEKMLAGDSGAWLEAIESAAPFEELTQLGSTVYYKVERGMPLQVSIRVNSESVVPAEVKSILQSGKLSVKPMPKGQFYELYQDYVCGCALRVAREAFALLPVEMVIVTALGEVLNSSTGHIDVVPILSAAIPRQTLLRLNFETLDPSDSLRNFLTRMEFKKTKGFMPITPILPTELGAAS